MTNQETSPLLPRTTSVSNPTDDSPPSENNTFTTLTNRTISYARYGSPNPTSPTIIYLHGYPSSRYEASLLHHLALRHNPPVRIIAPDRPGFGLTSPTPNRTIADYATIDLLPLIEHLSLSRFSILGLSGGGPYALAAAASTIPLLTPKVAGVGIACGAPHWSAQGPEGWAALPWWSKVGYYAAFYTPWLLRGFTAACIALVRLLAGQGWVQRRVDTALIAARERRKKLVEDRSGEPAKDVAEEVELVVYVALGEDSKEWSVSEQRESFVNQALEPFRQGTRAALEEFRIFCTEVGWGFKLQDVNWRGKQGEKVVMWHGTKDVNAPIECARWMAEQIGSDGVELREYEGTHGEVVVRFEEMLDVLSRPLLDKANARDGSKS
ncbi:uncharacterized protein AB675_6456 [Cyphellophora attinorum]|uniref:AB hydrolase-1 domain-containing protein n=1 Tax=Cyphellophora attinorum TaxID=1664694 RepID=A0A0N1HF05_9EURO|nr:uncharacterized protein AB675_6456 [Phialophora attinorum]KPI44192.1 hypothetical protein AB675_6456 [Phialophora attinorum]